MIYYQINGRAYSATGIAVFPAGSTEITEAEYDQIIEEQAAEALSIINRIHEDNRASESSEEDDMLLNEHELVFERGNQTGTPEVRPTILGYRWPVIHGGESFNAVQVYVNADSKATRIRFTVLKPNKDEILGIDVPLTSTVGYQTIILPRTVTPEDIGADHFFYGIETLEDLGIGFGTGTNTSPEVDHETVRVQTRNVRGIWADVSTASGSEVRPALIRAFNVIPSESEVDETRASTTPATFNKIALTLKSVLMTAGIATIGLWADSWGESLDNGNRAMFDNFEKFGGLRGPGYVSANRFIDTPFDDETNPLRNVTRNRSGVWEDVHTEVQNGGLGGFGPDGAHATTTDPDFLLRYNWVNADTYVLHYLQTPNAGTFRYQIGAGAFTTVDANGPDEYKTITISGAGQLEITTESIGGGLTFMGCVIYDSTSTNKWLVHKLASGGATSARVKNIPPAYFAAALESLGLDFGEFLLGTNDDIQDAVPDDMKSDLSDWVDALRSVNPAISLALTSPAENGTDDGVYPLSEYSVRMYELAAEKNTAYLNLKNFFGTFEQADARGWMRADQNHPSVIGGEVIGNIRFSNLIAPAL